MYCCDMFGTNHKPKHCKQAFFYNLHNSKASHQNNEIKISLNTECCQSQNSTKDKNMTRRKMKWDKDDDKRKHKGIQLFQIVLKEL